MPRRRTTCKTSSVRSTATAASRSRVLLAAALIALAGGPAAAANATGEAPPVETILAAYDKATHGVAADTIETSGTISGVGLSGTFHTWRAGDRERDDDSLGPRQETTLRIGDRIWRNSNGNVQELTGVLLRHARTDDFIESGAFVHAPDHVRFTGFGTLAGRRTWNVEVRADGGEPETLWIDAQNGLPLRTEYIDGDGPTYVDLSDWRDVGGMQIAFRAVTTDGEHAFDTIEQTASVKLGGTVDPALFAPLQGRRLAADGVQTVPLLDDGSRIACVVQIEGKGYAFLIDSGSGDVLLDSHVAQAAGIGEEGALEVRGAVRTGGLHVAKLPRLTIGGGTLDDLVVSTIDLGSEPGRMHVDGILGYPFFASSLVQLDFANRVMRFGPPGSFAPAGDRIDLDTDREIPEAVFRLDNSMDVPFIVDTGNSGGLLLYGPFVDAHPAVAPGLGSTAGSYVGVGGTDRSYGTRVRSLQLGSTTLSDQSADVIEAKSGAFADRIDAGNVGLGLLRKFVVTFDFANHALYLQRLRP
ncbi:MAG TPA: aspartyl protease family protein [Candidatus Lustribacter sp.]|jgi:hypothetical protein|nr:aspartyl protease family protein [Candidatus Lustribacter sp.]